jgi:hypothetical protein
MKNTVKFIGVMALMLAIIPGLAAQRGQPEQPSRGQDWSGTWEIHTRNGKAIDIRNHNSNNGVAIHQWDRSGRQNQQWQFEMQRDGSYIITNVHSNRVMDVSGGSRNNGAQIHQWERHGGDSQRWRIHTDGEWVRLENVNAASFMDVPNGRTDNGVQMQIWQGQPGNNNQRFRLVRPTPAVQSRDWSGTYEIHLRNGNVVDIRTTTSDNGVAIIQQARTGRQNQHWQFELQRDGSYIITNAHSGRVMDIQHHRTENGVRVHQWTRNNGQHQRWNIIQQRGDFVILQNAMTGLNLDMSRSNYHVTGHQFHQWANNDGENQQFQLVPVGGRGR